MISIVSKNVVKEGKAEEFKALAAELIKKSRGEDGCISYNLNEDINNSNILTFIEEWEDEQSIERHNSSEHFLRIVPKLGGLRENKELNKYVRI